MRICLVCDFSGNPDEGMKKIAHDICNHLAKKCDVYKFDLSKTFSVDMWLGLKRFNPEIIHYIPGPSAFSFLLLRGLKHVSKASKTIMLATHPKISGVGKYLIKFLECDLILTQSEKTNAFFHELKFNTQFFPNGVDTEIFGPVSNTEKINLRRKHGFDDDAYIILHVGHLKENRNVRLFCDLRENINDEIIIVGSTSTTVDKQLERSLEDARCTILNTYFKDIQEIYQLSDVYVFPTIDQENSIEIPLSILEAMACNLFVVTKKFGAVDEIFEECGGFYHYESIDDLLAIINQIKEHNTKSETRLLVRNYSWENLCEQLVYVYKNILKE